MLDRMLLRGLTLAVVLLEAVTGGGGLILLLSAWKNTLAAHWPAAAGHLGAAILCGIAVWWLVRHHEELKG
jgi:hypothetical protein